MKNTIQITLLTGLTLTFATFATSASESQDMARDAKGNIVESANKEQKPRAAELKDKAQSTPVQSIYDSNGKLVQVRYKDGTSTYYGPEGETKTK